MAKFSLKNLFGRNRNRKLEQSIINEFNQAFLWGSLGGQVLDDDINKIDYIELGYNINPDVYSVINQIANKLVSIPREIKKIDDDDSYQKLNSLENVTKGDYTIPQTLKALNYKDKAFSDDVLPMPLEVPNELMGWTEFLKLSEIFLNTCGEFYWYKLAPKDGMDSGVPIAWYVMPSHLMEIVLKPNASMLGVESPVDYYILREGNGYIKFDAEDIVHVTLPNPNFDQNGSHLYGQSPLRAAFKNIVSTNKGLDLTVNTMKNGGAFGFIHAKDSQTPLTNEQAVGVKARLKEMNADSSDLSRLGAISQSIGFTRISLTTDELKPFDYFSYNLKMLCNALQWDDKLLNSDDGAKYDNMKVAEKRVVTGKIIPDVKLFEDAINKHVLPLYKGYEDTCIKFLVKELPEMQQDYSTMIKWLGEATDKGFISRNTALRVMGMPVSEDTNMDIITVKDDVMTLEDAILPQDDLQI